MKRIHTYDGYKPHPSWKGWSNFLKNHCEKRREEKGVVFYGHVNCNYILFPDNFLVCNYGFHGNALMEKIKSEGVKKARKDIDEIHQEIKDTLKRLKQLNGE